jgi:hypothetical protein
LGLRNLQEQKTPNPKIKGFGVIASNGSRSRSRSSSRRKYQVIINSSERRNRPVTPPKPPAKIEKLNIIKKKAIQVEDISESQLPNEIRSPDRPTKDTEIAQSNYSSVYSYDS